MSFDSLPEFLMPLYWLSTRPASVETTAGRAVFAVFLFVFVLGVALRVMASKQVDKYKTIALQRAGGMLVTMGLLGAVLYFFSSERIQFFGGRFWYPLWVIAIFVWGGAILYYVKKKVPLMREEAIMRKEKLKYLPKKKRKKKR